jgi:hypothetical protein
MHKAARPVTERAKLCLGFPSPGGEVQRSDKCLSLSTAAVHARKDEGTENAQGKHTRV